MPLAAYQVSATIWTFLAFALDALAIAAQALTGQALGAGDIARARSATRTMLSWGVLGGGVLGILVLATHSVLPELFTPDPAVQSALAAALIVVGLSQPIAGFVFVLDGVLIGAGDGLWLAVAQVGLLALYLPLILTVRATWAVVAGRHGHRRRAGTCDDGALAGVRRLHDPARTRPGLAGPRRRLAGHRRHPLSHTAHRCRTAGSGSGC